MLLAMSWFDRGRPGGALSSATWACFGQVALWECSRRSEGPGYLEPSFVDSDNLAFLSSPVLEKSLHVPIPFTKYCHRNCCAFTQSCLSLCNPMDCSTPGFSVLHCLLQFVHTHVHRFGDAIQPSHPLSSSSPPAFNLSQYQGLFQWVSSWLQVAKVLELQL